MDMEYLPNEEVKCFTAMGADADAVEVELHDVEFSTKAKVVQV